MELQVFFQCHKSSADNNIYIPPPTLYGLQKISS